MRLTKAFTYDVVELDFYSQIQYDNPYIDCNFTVDFYSPVGNMIKVKGFWDGDNNWKVRFSPDCTGIWKWVSISENITDIGLHDKSGEFEVIEYNGSNAILKHGFLKVTENGRGFCHQDGKPFFWLGDTVWGATAKATSEDWEEFIEYRSKQNFNTVCLDALPQYDASEVASFRQPFSMQGNKIYWDQPNCEYFRYLDRMMQISHRAGVFTAMVALWFDYVPGANLSWGTERKEGLSAELAARYGSYMAARYAAYGTIWMICGDSDFENEESISIYDAAAKAIKAVTPYKPMITAHLMGALASPEVLNEKDWLTFHMYQSSHTLDSLKNSISCAEKDRAYYPVRPVLNGEPPYENISTFKLLEEKMDRDFVREILWKSIITGANAGITYGAHGIWNWQCEGEDFEGAENWGMPDNWRDALRYEGASDAARMKHFFEEIEWWKLEPISNRIELADYPECMAAALSDLSVIVAYTSPGKVLSFRGQKDKKYIGVWFNPSVGTRIEAVLEENIDSMQVSSPPWNTDAVIFLVNTK